MAADTRHPCFPQPASITSIWRYLDLSIFLDLIQTQEIHFSRADQFEDPYEVSLPVPNQMLDYKELVRNSVPPGVEFHLTEEQVSQMAEFLRDGANYPKKNAFISCWAQGEHESMALWKIYTKSKNAVAVKCDYAKMVEQLSDKVMIGKVQYRNYFTEMIPINNFLYQVMSKRQEYSYETEIRAVMMNQESPKEFSFLRQKIDLPSVVQAVYVSPGCSDFFPNQIKDLTRKYGFDFQIIRSDLYDKVGKIG